MADDQGRTAGGLTPARELAEKARKAWPGESEAYGEARKALLAEEIELRRHIEHVAAQRRALPPGPPVAKDYGFIGEDGNTVTLADLFGGGDTLVVYIWMFGPQSERPCPMCTALLGPLDANAADIARNVPVVAVARAPVKRQAAFKAERGWRNLRVYQSVGDDFSRDHRALSPEGEDWPAMLVFTRDPDGTVRLFWSGEMSGETADPGQDPRGAPDISPLWNILDLTPAGRKADWYPKLDYPAG